jgi:peptide-methionine (S)-S-oxide reductase
MATEKATLGGGCFWCLEAVFLEVEGVTSVVPGYEGGEVKHPTYQQVCSGRTGHAEVVQVSFDTDIISFEEILNIFFSIHDPTTLNRQGHDVGPQYRSVIFTHSAGQQRIAQKVIDGLNAAGLWDDPVVTEVAESTVFYAAEEYHHRYFEKNPHQGYCQAVIAPKVGKFRKDFSERLKT